MLSVEDFKNSLQENLEDLEANCILLWNYCLSSSDVHAEHELCNAASLMLWMTLSFNMGSLAGLGIREGPCSPPGDQKTRIQGYQFESTCVIACVIDSKEHYLLKQNVLKRRWGETASSY